MSTPLTHEDYMRRAIALGKKAPAAPFGALIVDERTGMILAEGWNRFAENPIWHGEIDALNALARHSPGIDGGTLRLVTTAEPCPMCQSAILWAGIGTVVFGTSIATLQEMGWQQIEIAADEVIRRTPFRRCVLIGGILKAECDALFATPPGRYAT